MSGDTGQDMAGAETGRKAGLSPITTRWFGTAAIASIGMILGGYLLGDGLLRAKEAERSVTVRGLAERDVTADLATWTISYSASSESLAEAQGKVRRDTESIEEFFSGLGFPDDALQPTGANVSSYTNRGVTTYTVRQRLALRTNDIERAQKAVAQQFDLVGRGVFLEEGSGMSYTFTRLNDIKPEMVAEATKEYGANRGVRIAANTRTANCKLFACRPPSRWSHRSARSRTRRRGISRSTRVTAMAGAGASRTAPTRRSAWSRPSISASIE